MFFRLSNAFAFTDTESPTINILYGCSGISGQFGCVLLCLLL